MISNKVFSDEILLIAEKIREEDGDLFLVGGSVRDLVLGINPLEYDFEIYGNVEKRKEYILLAENDKKRYLLEFIEKMKLILKTFGNIDEIGKSFGVLKMENKPYDFSFPRKENKSGITRKDYEIFLNPFLDFRDAQKRRDLTINTLMYSFNKEVIIDNFNGLGDIKNKIIRIVDSETFAEDPLRVYRIGQFVSRLGFSVDDETLNLSKDINLSSLSVERIHWEMEKLFTGKNIQEGLSFLNKAMVFIKRHLEFSDLYNKNVEKHKYINEINDYFTIDMKMTEKFTFIFILFLEESNFEIYLAKVKGILKTFTKNKKDVESALLNILSVKTIIDYLTDKINYEETVFNLVGKDTKYLNLYLDFWLKHTKLNELLKKNLAIKDIIKIVSDFSPLITGKDLLEMGFVQSERFNLILNEAIKMQIKGNSKKEILNIIRGRDEL